MAAGGALAQDNDRAPKRLPSPRDSVQNQDRRMQNQDPRPPAPREQQRHQMQRQDQGRPEAGPWSPGPGMRGQGFPGPREGQAFNRQRNGPGPGICPECKRPLGPMAGPGFGPGAQGRQFRGPGMNGSGQFGRGRPGAYAWNHQRQFGPRQGMGPMNWPPMKGRGQFRGNQPFGGPGRGPAMGPPGQGQWRPGPMMRGNDQRPPVPEQGAPQRTPNRRGDLREGGPRGERGNADRPPRPDRED